MLRSLDNRTLSFASNVCFVTVVAAAGFSMLGLVDAYVAVDLAIFNAITHLPAAIFGFGMAAIAVAGIAGTVFAARLETGPVANEPTETPSPEVNSKLDARRLQTMLHVLRYPIRIDGVFGAQTTGSIRDFQTAAELEIDGIVDPLTLEALQKQVEAHGRSEWVVQILDEYAPPMRSAPRLTLVGAPRSA